MWKISDGRQETRDKRQELYFYVVCLVSFVAGISIMEKVGRVIHYYDSARLAVIKVERGGFKIGDTIIIQDATDEARKAEQVVMVMQLDIDRMPHEVARAGEEVRVRVEQRAEEGDAVYKK